MKLKIDDKPIEFKLETSTNMTILVIKVKNRIIDCDDALIINLYLTERELAKLRVLLK